MEISPNTEELKNEVGSLIWRMATNLVHGGKVSPVQFMDYTREKVDIKELNQRIAQIVAREQKLRTAIDAIVEELEA